ncbi:MAG TPA: LamG domain-containing protein [Cyclobacteriaceae bacterium]|jgi:hypothetical protein|nr:LamG domain-containing protein [Cyclobacteriaceae bacterium]
MKFRLGIFTLIVLLTIQSCHKDDAPKFTLTDDLICYLPMNGNALDASLAANTTLVQGATLTTGRKSVPNTAYNMNGISNDIMISNSKALDTLQNMTLTAWIKPVSFDGNGNSGIIEKAYYSHINPYYQYKLGITGDQHLSVPGSFVFSLSINGTYQVVYSPAGTWTPGNWYFVSGTYDGKKMVVFVNGVAAASYTISGKVDHYGTDLYVGVTKNPEIYTPGTFGDLRIYNRALSAAEINALYSK